VNENHSTRTQQFLQLYEVHVRSFERYAWALTRDREWAADLLQSTITEVWQAFDAVRDQQAFPAFVYTVMTRLYGREKRRSARFVPFTQEVANELFTSDLPPDRCADVVALITAINNLTEPLRTTATLFYITDLSMESIATIQSTTVAAVKMRLLRVRNTLRTVFSDMSDVPTEVRS